MQLVENIAEVVGRVVHTSNVKVAGIMVVKVIRSSIVPNCSKIVPLHETTLVDEYGIRIIVAVHDQNCLKTVDLHKKKSLKLPYYHTAILTHGVCGSEKAKWSHLVPKDNHHPVSLKVSIDLGLDVLTD